MLQSRPAAETLIEEALEEGVFPGVEVLFAQGEKVLLHRAYGRTSGAEQASALETGRWFDLASLTKPLATGLAVMKLVEIGRLHLRQRVCEWFPSWEREETKRLTLLDLLAHRSGLPAWAPLYQRPDEAAALEALLALPLEVPPQTKVIYSCLNFILLAQIVRLASGQTLEAFCRTRLYEPWGIEGLRFNPGPLEEVLPSAHCPWRGRRLHGEVHDENSARFGGQGGNAGLFGRAEDLHRLALELLNPKPQGPLSASSLDLMRANQNPPELAPRGLAWDHYRPGYGYYSCGDLFGPGSFGHLGFTGTGLWIDPERQWIAIHLSHRVWYGAQHRLDEMRRFRARLHNTLIGDFS